MSLTKVYEIKQIIRGFSVNYVVYLVSEKKAVPHYIFNVRVWRKSQEFGTMVNYDTDFSNFNNNRYSLNGNHINGYIDSAIELYLETESKESKQ